MVTVDTFELIQTGIMGLFFSAFGALFWMRFNQLERRIESVDIGLRREIHDLRTEMHEEIRALRSDLTQVALAVGVRPRLVEE